MVWLKNFKLVIIHQEIKWIPAKFCTEFQTKRYKLIKNKNQYLALLASSQLLKIYSLFLILSLPYHNRMVLQSSISSHLLTGLLPKTFKPMHQYFKFNHPRVNPISILLDRILIKSSTIRLTTSPNTATQRSLKELNTKLSRITITEDQWMSHKLFHLQILLLMVNRIINACQDWVSIKRSLGKSLRITRCIIRWLRFSLFELAKEIRRRRRLGSSFLKKEMKTREVRWRKWGSELEVLISNTATT